VEISYKLYSIINNIIFIQPPKAEENKMVKVQLTILIMVTSFFAHGIFGMVNDEDLLKKVKLVSGSLPSQIVSKNNSITPEKILLGKILIYETRISIDGTVSCIRCHPMGLYAADGLKKSIGNNSKLNPRNAPTLLNAAGQISAHWIGNRLNVEDQAKQAVIGPPSFGMPSYEAAAKQLKGLKNYNLLFKNAFPEDNDPITIDNFAKAVGAFERTLVTPSPYDAFIEGEANALMENQKTGLKIFLDTGCIDCHSSAFFGGQMYRKFGVFGQYWEYTKSDNVDEGRYSVTKNESDKYVFKVPILRNIEKTSPYFHDGSVPNLEEAVKIMGIVQLAKNLSASQVESLIYFLKSLTGRIPEDALKIPILPSQE
jgi:cytochrome c peroxidase